MYRDSATGRQPLSFVTVDLPIIHRYVRKIVGGRPSTTPTRVMIASEDSHILPDREERAKEFKSVIECESKFQLCVGMSRSHILCEAIL